MSEEPEKRAFIDHLLKMASERWGEDVVEQLRSALERIADAIWTVEDYDLKLEEEPKLAGGS